MNEEHKEKMRIGRMNKEKVKYVEIHLIKDYWLTADKYQWMLSRKIDQTKSAYKHLGFFTDLNLLLRELINIELRHCNAKTLPQLRIEVERLMRQVESIYHSKLVPELNITKEVYKKK